MAQRETATDRTKRSPTISRRKLWAFRIATALVIPLALFAVLEFGLRVFGFGDPTGFFLRSEQYDKPVLIENPRFGWRFFGPRLARAPAAMSIAAQKPKDTVRVCVFGESAAFGDPQPEFGLPRMLQAMLSLRHPHLRFEVINAAMTGINSHTVRAIAKDCLATESDLWVVYMGNNEVVGPFGAGTVFGSQTPPLPLVRANLAFKTTRVGQLLELILAAQSGGATGDKEWGGMEMFTKNQVARDDPRMATVYHHFEHNLRDIVELGRRNNIGVIVSTVGVNLKDCAPFAAATRPELAADKRLEWATHYRSAIKSQQAGDHSAALAAFEKAATIDDTNADLEFRWGQSLLATGDVPAARRHLQLACDLDQLRFRCDSRLNDITREVARGHEAERIRFVDAADKFHEESSPQISGRDLFYEHVHLTFEGNYLLARLIAGEAESLLPEFKRSGAQVANWPTRDQCAARLGWSNLALHNALSELLRRLDDPPFPAQLNHLDQLHDFVARLGKTQEATQPAGLAQAAEQLRRATEQTPDDHMLFSQLALLLGKTGDLEGAYQAAQMASQLLPHSAGKLYQLGIILGMQQHDEDAVKVFKQALAHNRDDILCRHELAKTLIRLNRKDEALDELRQAVAINPHFGTAYLTIGVILEERKQINEADENYHLAVKHRMHRLADLTAVAQICHRKQWFEDAATVYLEALRLSPSDSNLHLAAAQCLAALGRNAEANVHSAQIRYQVGVQFAKAQQPAEAADHFQAAADLDPNFLDARIDYGMALIATNRYAEALEQFKKVLAKDPNQKTALEYKALLEKELGIMKEH